MKLEPTDFRTNQIDHGVTGVDPIVRGGTEIPKDKEKQVRDACANAGEELQEVK